MGENIVWFLYLHIYRDKSSNFYYKAAQKLLTREKNSHFVLTLDFFLNVFLASLTTLPTSPCAKKNSVYVDSTKAWKWEIF